MTMTRGKLGRAIVAFAAFPLAVLQGGPYSAALGDPGNLIDAPVPGFIGPHGTGKPRLFAGPDDNGMPIYQNPANFVNPLFFGWAETVDSYQRSDSSASFADPSLGLGPVTGDPFDIVSLGDLTAAQIAAGSPPGTITLTFSKPIENHTGADFVVFENGLISQNHTGGAGIGGIFAELAYVEVSADGVNFIRFPATSLTPAAVGGYGSIHATDVHHLAGKHANGNGESWGTPFDLTDVGLPRITAIRLVDIPGNGTFKDSVGRPIYDAWLTFGSGGFDLEAVGAISVDMTFGAWPALTSLDPGQRGPNADPDGDGVSNLLEYASGGVPWLPDSIATKPTLQLNADFSDFDFLRDERAADVTYEVQAAENPAGPWKALASGTAGQPLTPEPGSQVEILENSASSIQSVGVIRRVTVRERNPSDSRRFYRLSVTVSSTP